MCVCISIHVCVVYMYKCMVCINALYVVVVVKGPCAGISLWCIMHVVMMVVAFVKLSNLKQLSDTLTHISTV